MIPRYSLPEMTALWSDDARYSIWLEVETMALEAMVEQGLAPREALEALQTKAAFEVGRIQEIEKEVKHDVIAFLTNLAEHVGPLSRYVHRGMTSSDLLDTSLALQLSRSADLILDALGALQRACWQRAVQYKNLITIGRSHGVHAEPTSFGLKILTWYAELQRAEVRIREAQKEIQACKLAGAVGTYVSLPPSIEAKVAERLGLYPESVSTQVVARDRHASFFSSLALLAASIDRICIEIRHLQRTEVREVEEPFGKGQKGSSAMPHKKNPILTENLSGLSRMLKSYAQSALDNVALWHERDISHSSVERIIGPDACILAHFMCVRLTEVVEGLTVHEDRVQENLESMHGVIFSGSLLVALVDGGMTREDAYRLVQAHALEAWKGGPNFQERVRSDADITKTLNDQDIAKIFDLQRHIAHVDFIFERVGKKL